MNTLLPCRYCGQHTAVVKAGKNPSGSQRYRCQTCRRYFTAAPRPMGHPAATRQWALKLALEGMSGRAIARQLGVTHQSVANWLHAHDYTLPAHVVDTTATPIIEVDELYTFVGSKKKKSTS